MRIFSKGRNFKGHLVLSFPFMENAMGPGVASDEMIMNKKRDNTME